MSEIDVSKCQFYQNGICYNNGSWGSDFFECAINNNCYYKELQALKQENEVLKDEKAELNELLIAEKEEKESLICSANCYKYKRVEELQQKLEKIKEICESVRSNGLDEEVDKFDDILNIIESEE